MYEKPNDDENFYRLDRSFTLFKLFMTHFLLLSNTSLACYVELLCYKTVTNMWTHYCITTGPFIYIQGDSRPLQQTLRDDRFCREEHFLFINPYLLMLRSKVMHPCLKRFVHSAYYTISNLFIYRLQCST